MTGKTFCLWVKPQDKGYGADVETVFSSGSCEKCALCGGTHELNRRYKTDLSASYWNHGEGP